MTRDATAAGSRPIGRVMAQVAMVMNLDKCIGCHTCSVTCKQTWTNRTGVEYAWFNNVETKPGVGYPRRYEDQEQWKGGWTLDRRGRLVLRSGGRVRRLMSLFSNPDLPTIEDYYEPVTYDYDTLISAPAGNDVPVASPRSALTGRPTSITWGANWEDDLGGAPRNAGGDPNLSGEWARKVKFEFEQTFMFHLPRLCEHCLNPACVSACPSGAMYKRVEDGIVLVDQDRCRGWRMCVTACPYKKVYINHHTGKAEKCTFCFPRIEEGQPTVCSETCVGRLRYLGIVLYDPDRVGEAAATPDEKDLLDAQRDVLLDPEDPEVIAAARRSGIPEDWLDAARRSPVYALISRYRVALPLHPEFRTLPMVWYVPPLSPVLDAVDAAGGDQDNPDHVFAAVTRLRIPLEYLAGLFTAGDTDVVAGVLMKLTALRSYMREKILAGQEAHEEDVDDAALRAVGLTPRPAQDLHRLLAVAKYADRYVIPAAHKEDAAALEALSAVENRCPVEHAGGESVEAGSGGRKVMLGIPTIRRRTSGGHA